MSDNKLITFTEEEQLKLGELEVQAQEYVTWRNCVSRSLHAGQDGASIARLLQFLQHMAVNASKQIDEVRASAQARSKDIKPVADSKAN